MLDVALRLGGRVYSVDVSRLSTSWARFAYRGFIERGVLVVEEGDLRGIRYADSAFGYSAGHATMHHIDPEEIPVVVGELWERLRGEDS